VTQGIVEEERSFIKTLHLDSLFLKKKIRSLLYIKESSLSKLSLFYLGLKEVPSSLGNKASAIAYYYIEVTNKESRLKVIIVFNKI
jgi:hypothetical protein